MADEVNRLCEKYCFGCDMGHCKPIYHDCIIMGDREKWFNYEGVAVRNVKQERKIWEEFKEALTLLGLRCHKHAVNRFKELEETPSMLLYLWVRYNATPNPELERALTHLKHLRTK